MLKLNKGLHFNILTIFAIVFVCVYLYYTISDLKKVAVEVKKHTQDITNIATSLATLNKHIEDLKKKGSASTSESCRVVPKVTVTAATVTASDKGKGVSASPITNSADDVLSYDTKVDDEEEAEEEEDNDSVSTNDVKNLLSSIPDEHDADDENDDNDDVDVEVEEDVLVAVENTLNTEPVTETSSVVSVPKSYKDLSVDELKQQSYDDLKKYCKDNGLSTKGTKDVIIQRIKA